jgi:hypothetical protein
MGDRQARTGHRRGGFFGLVPSRAPAASWPRYSLGNAEKQKKSAFTVDAQTDRVVLTGPTTAGALGAPDRKST